MLLKIKAGMIAGLIAAALLASCRSILPWRDEPLGTEINLALTMENNLLFLTTATINGQPGRFFLGSAHPRTVIDPKFAQTVPGRSLRMQISEKESLPISPVPLPLGGIGDAIIGAEAWGRSALTIDYKVGLATYQKLGIRADLMTVYSYEAEPALMISVDGQARRAIVDTASPDTVTLPARSGNRARARVILAGVDFGEVDVRYADVPQARVGNRLLSKFLITIDYGRQQVGLWRDPRIPLNEIDD